MGADVTRRQFLGTAMVAGGGSLLLAACGGTSSPKPKPTAIKLPPIEGAQLITDPSQFPKKFSESPQFAQLVSAGRLPAVEERIGQDPLVLKPVGETGKYGGVLRRGIVGLDENNGNRFVGNDSLVYWDNDFKNVIPNIARDFEVSSDGKVTTLHLRRGMKWSDGESFTADDIIFWHEDIDGNSDLSKGAQSLRTAGGPVQVKKVDAVTVEYISPVPNPVLPRLMAGSFDISGLSNDGFNGGGGFAPKHYLSKYLPKYTSESDANKAARAAGFASWPLYVLHLLDWAQNPAMPMLTPWLTTRPVTNAPWTLEANPYSIFVDTAGNQLPYIPKITIADAGNNQVLNLKAVGGEYDFQDRSLQLSSLPVLSANEKKSNYTVYRDPTDEMEAGFRLNLAYVKDKTIGDLLRKVEFRRALSLGIDRDQVNQVFFLGTSHPSASMVADSSVYFPGKEWRTKWATHDVAQANKLLDGLGLTKKDGSGFRLRPDGKGRIQLEAVATAALIDFPGIAQMVSRQWKKIGISLIVQTLDPKLLVERILGNEVQIMAHQSTLTTDVFVNPANTLPTNGVSGVIGIPYATWLGSGGKSGTRPPAELKIEDAWRMYQQGLQESDEQKRIQLAKEIYKMHADLVWSIGIVGQGISQGLHLASNRLGNVPRRIINDTLIESPVNARSMTFYFKS